MTLSEISKEYVGSPEASIFLKTFFPLKSEFAFSSLSRSFFFAFICSTEVWLIVP